MMLYKMMRSAVSELGVNKLRTALTMLGIVIGVGAVIALMSVGQGASKGIAAEVNALGSNLLFVEPGAPGEETDTEGFSTASFTLTADDVEALRQSTALPNVEAVSAVSQIPLDSQVTAGGNTAQVTMTATDEYFMAVRDFELEAGSYFSAQDLDRKTRNTVLGSQTAIDLFGSAEAAIGQKVRINFGPFSLDLTVIGVMKERGASGEGSEDEQMFMPLSTFQARVPFARSPTGGQSVSQIVIKVDDSGKVDSSAEQVRSVLLTEHDFSEDFTVKTQNDLKSTAENVGKVMTILLGAIAGISLFVGGIGIMNIMLVSVSERTREIGIRKAVGARRNDILTQFIVETVVVTLLGGLVGVALGVTVALTIDGHEFGTGSSIGTAVTPLSVGIAFFVSAIIGLFFGIYPAFRASRLDPIEALRTE